MIALTESCEACFIEPASISFESTKFSFNKFVCKLIFLIFFSGDQLGPLRSLRINLSSSLNPSKNFFQLSGKEFGSER